MTARNSSVSKNSATKSATAIDDQRKKLKIPALPRRRTSRPVLKRFQKSSGLGLSIAGGVIEVSCLRTSEMDSSNSANPGYFAASFSENWAMPAAVLAASL
jgi:hypothetical protein